MTKREEQKVQRRNDILYAALNLFVERGYVATKTSDIAKFLGISDGLLFHYFPTKEDLYYELVKVAVESTDIYSKMDEKKPYDIFYETLKVFFDGIKEDRSIAKMFLLADQARNKDNTPLKVYREAMKLNIVKISVADIEMGQRRKVFRKGDAYGLSCTFWNSFSGVMKALARDEEMPVPEPDWLMSILVMPKEKTRRFFN